MGVIDGTGKLPANAAPETSASASAPIIQRVNVKGDPGTSGVNAYTSTKASFVMPPANDTTTVEVAVEDADWMGIGQPLFIESAGFLIVNSIASSTSVLLVNPGAAGNASSSTVIASGVKVSPGGVPGVGGGGGGGDGTVLDGGVGADNLRSAGTIQPVIIINTYNGIVAFAPGSFIESNYTGALSGLGHFIDGNSDRACAAGGYSHTIQNSLYGFIGGGQSHVISGAQYGTISGGGENSVLAYAGTVRGGQLNSVTGQYSDIGGYQNIGDGQWGFIGGGQFNTERGNYGNINGGYSNATGSGLFCPSVLGGQSCNANGAHAGVGGYFCSVNADNSFCWGNGCIVNGQYALAVGLSCIVDQDGGVATGTSAHSFAYGLKVHTATGIDGAQGGEITHWGRSASGATVPLQDALAGDLFLRNGFAYMIRAVVCANQGDAVSVPSGWTFDMLVQVTGGALVIQGGPTPISSFVNNLNYSIAFAPSLIPQCLQTTFTGDPAQVQVNAAVTYYITEMQGTGT